MLSIYSGVIQASFGTLQILVQPAVRKTLILLIYFGKFLCILFLFIQENKKTNMESCSNVNDECYTAKGLSCQSKDGSNMCLWVYLNKSF